LAANQVSKVTLDADLAYSRQTLNNFNP